MGFYNLLMSANEELWDSSPAKFPLDRIFEYTDSVTKTAFLDNEGRIDRILLNGPCLFSYEFPLEKDSHIGWIRHIEYESEDALLHFEIDPSFPKLPFSIVKSLRWQLEIEKLEEYRHHWAVKNVDLPTTLAMNGAFDPIPTDQEIGEVLRVLSAEEKPEDDDFSREEIKNNVFISYCHKDTEFLARLQVHLKSLARIIDVVFWDDTKIDAGDNWRGEIDREISRASVAILIVSADFLASDFIQQNELPPLLKSAHDRGCRIIPIIAKPCLFTDHPELSAFQSINDPNESLITCSDADKELVFNKVSATILQISRGTN